MSVDATELVLRTALCQNLSGYQYPCIQTCARVAHNAVFFQKQKVCGVELGGIC